MLQPAEKEQSSTADKGDGKAEGDGKADGNVIARARLPLYVLVVSLLAFPLGWDVGTLGAMVNLALFRARYAVPGRCVGLVLATFNAGAVAACAAFAAARWADRHGCLALFRMAFAVYLAGSMGATLALFRGGVWLFLAARFAQGAACGVLCVVAPVYVCHLCSLVPGAQHLLATHQVLVCGAILAGNVLFAQTWRCRELAALAVPVAVAAAALVALLSLPEAPRDCLVRGDTRAVAASLRRLVKGPDAAVFPLATRLLRSVPLAVAPNTAERARRRGAMAVCALLLVFQQLTGINFFFYYGRVLFDGAVAHATARRYALVVLSVVNVVGAAASGPVLARFGTRRLLLAGLAALAALLTAFAAVGVASLLPAAGAAMLACAAGVILTFAVSWGPGVSIAATQIADARPELVTAGVVCGWLANVAVLTATPVLIDRVGHALGFVFAAFTALLAVFVYVYLPGAEVPGEVPGSPASPQAKLRADPARSATDMGTGGQRLHAQSN